MSFIMQRYKCKDCQYEFNVALGTFGFGMPTKCPNCDLLNGSESNLFQKIADGWPEFDAVQYKIEKMNKDIVQVLCVCGALITTTKNLPKGHKFTCHTCGLPIKLPNEEERS